MRFHPADWVLYKICWGGNPTNSGFIDSHLAECSRCRQRIQWMTLRPPQQAGEYGIVFELLRSDREVLCLRRQSERIAVDLLFEQSPHASIEDLSLSLRDFRYQTWFGVERLIELSQAQSFLDPIQAEKLARLAARTAIRLSGVAYGVCQVEDLRARAWAQLGNSLRLRFNFVKAERAFFKARAFLDRGTGDPLERAVLLDLWGSLMLDQRRFTDAERFLRRAVSLFRRQGDDHRAGRSLIGLSNVLGQKGFPDRGAALLLDARKLLDPAEDPRLFMILHHNLVGYLAESGRLTEAILVLKEIRGLYARFPEPWAANRFDWLCGRVARELGRFRLAQKFLARALEGFSKSDLLYDTALVTLDLAQLLHEQGKWAEVRILVGKALPLLASGRIERESLAALALLRPREGASP